MMEWINLDLMRNPLNWATVFLMCLFALVLLALLAPQQI